MRGDPDPVDDRIILLVEEGKTMREISEEVNKALANVHERIQKLCDKALLVRELEAGKAVPYRVTEHGKAYLLARGYKRIELFKK